MVTDKNRGVVFGAWLSEVQAIAIYESEIRFLERISPTPDGDQTLKLCQKILQEECDHSANVLGHLEAHAPLSLREKIQARASRAVGYALGASLSLLPTRTSWQAHAWAERQAAQIYADAYEQVPLEELRHAHEQELGHAALFEELLKR